MYIFLSAHLQYMYMFFISLTCTSYLIKAVYTSIRLLGVRHNMFLSESVFIVSDCC